MRKYIIKLLLGSLLIPAGYYFFDQNGLRFEIMGAGILLLVDMIFIDLVYDLWTNWKRVSLVVKCKWLAVRDQKIRFSMSYLYRIKVNDKYLLVKSSNFPHYQLVGGKYKRLPGTQSMLHDRFAARDDLQLSPTGLMKDDFALFVPAKNAIKFIDWFNSGRNREISHQREFYEELIEGKARLLSLSNWPYVTYNYVGMVITPIKRTPGWDCFEILQYDILDLIPNAAQLRELEALLQKGDTDYIKWADDELISGLGHCKRSKKQLYKIGAHTKWAVNMKWSQD